MASLLKRDAIKAFKENKKRIDTRRRFESTVNKTIKSIQTKKATERNQLKERKIRDIKSKRITDLKEFKSKSKKVGKEQKVLRQIADKRSVKKRLVSQAKDISTKASGRLKKIVKAVPKKSVMRKQPRSTLDLRNISAREVPVKQHGFKESDIENKNFLFN